MSKKHNHHRHAPTCAGRPTSDDWLEAEKDVEKLIAAQHSKAAVEAAKGLHKSYGTAASEGLLIRAYEARIRDLLSHEMLTEAKALVNLVIQRFPAAVTRVKEVSLELCMEDGKLEEFVAPLRDSNLDGTVRERIESAIRQRVWDLQALSQAASLPPDHSLRQAAAALSTALAAVTTGPAETVDLLLPAVSHRSPLAPWKALVNAVAAFYRKEDETCKKWLAVLPQDSAPARLVPVMHAMLGIQTSVGNSAAQKLMIATGTGSEVLREILASLDSALGTNKRQEIIRQAAAAVSACEQYRPDIVTKVRQYIAVRCLLLDFAPGQLRAAIAGSALVNAQWFRLVARAMETCGSESKLAFALVAWYEFRCAALEEKWFAPNSTEDGVLWVHMAELAAGAPNGLIEVILDPETNPNWRVKKGDLTLTQLFSPPVLYEKASAADPHPEVFQSWLAWAKRQPNPRAADHAAEAWQKACPEDVSPLLWLMDSSEKRGAYQKSLNYLEQAERIDRLNPQVRRAKLRLLVASAVRHFRQRKPHLAAQEISQIEALAAVDGNLKILVNALQTVCAALARDSDSLWQYAGAVGAQLGNPAAAHILHRAILKASTLPDHILPQLLDMDSYEIGMVLKGLVKACSLGDSVGIPIYIPELWEDRLISALTSPGFTLATSEALLLGEAAIRNQASRLAFALSVVGLAHSGADARFLFLRARALPAWASERRYDCLCAALQLARRDHAADLLARLLPALDQHRSSRYDAEDFVDEMGPEGYSMAPAELGAVLEEERAAKQFPVSSRRDPVTREVETQDPFEEDDFPELEELLADMPEDAARALNKAIARGASSEEILKYILFGSLGHRPLEELTSFLPAELSREIKKLAAMDLPWRKVLEVRKVFRGANWLPPELPNSPQKQLGSKVGEKPQQNLF